MTDAVRQYKLPPFRVTIPTADGKDRSEAFTLPVGRHGRTVEVRVELRAATYAHLATLPDKDLLEQILKDPDLQLPDEAVELAVRAVLPEEERRYLTVVTVDPWGPGQCWWLCVSLRLVAPTKDAVISAEAVPERLDSYAQAAHHATFADLLVETLKKTLAAQDEVLKEPRRWHEA